MKKKVFSLCLCLALLLSVLTGCIHQDMGVKMNKDGTGSITTTLGIKKDFYEQMKGMGSDPFEGKTVSEYQYDGDTYVSCAETKEYSSYEDMEKALFTVDELTGIIQAAARMRPAGITDMEISSFMKKFKDKKFAAKCDRELIRKGCEMLGMEVKEVAAICIEAMKAHAEELQIGPKN